ncbi:hypothetical protein NC651_022808 [Populus alba x Populus x berolinensis]|nr:hypothetical protein NC651_022808 [Populus alba x Populus x berolinensis]
MLAPREDIQTDKSPSHQTVLCFSCPMASLWSPGILLVLLLAFLLKTLPLVILAKSNVYIVYMGDKIHDEPELVQESHHELLSDIVGNYKHGFSGFAAVLTESQAKLIADFPGVDGVVLNRILSSHTTRSWDFLHIKPRVVGGTLSKGHSGVGSIIGVTDTEVYGQSQKASEMRVYQRCHLVGEGHAIARKERDLIACSNRLKLIFSFYTGFTVLLNRFEIFRHVK